MLDEQFVLKMIRPHLNSRCELSAFEFYEIFSDLERKEQYEVINIMIRNDIEYVDEKEEEINELKRIGISSIDYGGDYRHLMSLKNEQLCLMFQKGDCNALSALLVKNERFVFMLANKLHAQINQTALTVEDLCSEGNFGLIEAAQRFDISQDNQFITYAWHWVRQRITRTAIDTGFLIRLPVHVYERIMKIHTCRRKHPEVYTTEALLDIINADGLFGGTISQERLSVYLQYEEHLLKISSLNSLVGEDNETELANFIPDSGASVEDIVTFQLLSEEISSVLASLKPREIGVLQMRYGLNGYTRMTLEEVGTHYNLTRERIRQIEAKAIRKLQHPSRRKRLAPFMEDFGI